MGELFWSRALCRLLTVALLATGLTTLARDQYFDVTVARARCGYEVLPHATWLRPEGQYCIVHLAFRNVTGAPVRLTLTAWFQYAYSSDGTRHPGRMLATTVESQHHNPFLRQVAPGARTGGLLVFDLPKGQHLTSLRIKESITSPGVTLRV
jgi:hypothetical protein